MKWYRLRTLLQREIRATLRDPFTMSVLVLVPLGSLLAFSFILSTEVQHLPLGVLDADQSTTSRQLVADIAASGAFEPRVVPTRGVLERALVSGEVNVGLVIPPGFERDLRGVSRGEPPPEVQAIYDASEAPLAGNAEGYLRSLVAASGARLVDRAPGATGISVATRALFNPRLDGVPFMVAGTFGFVLSFLTTLITAVSIVNERLSGTFEQLQVTPATSLEIFLGKILPLGAVFALDVVLMVCMAGLVMGVWPRGSVPLFVGISSFYVLISLALGLIFSATSATAAEAVQKTVLFSIPLVQLSGFAFPIRNMPVGIRWIAEALPATHYIRLSRALYMRATEPLALLPDFSVLLLFGIVLIALSLRTIGART